MSSGKGVARRVTMKPCGSRRLRRPSCSAGARSTRFRSSASRCVTTPRRSRAPRPSRSGSKGLESARQRRSIWNYRSRAESGPPRSACTSRRPISPAARGRSPRSRRVTASGPSWRPRSGPPRPAGRCGWSATSTTTRSGGTPRASSPSPGCCCRTSTAGGPTCAPRSSWSSCTWRTRARTRTTSSCWPRSTTSSRTWTPTRSTGPSCGSSSPAAGWRSSAATTTSRTPT